MATSYLSLLEWKFQKDKITAFIHRCIYPKHIEKDPVYIIINCFEWIHDCTRKDIATHLSWVVAWKEANVFFLCPYHGAW